MTWTQIVELIAQLPPAERRELFKHLQDAGLFDEQVLEAVDPRYEGALKEELGNFLPLRGKKFDEALADPAEREKILDYLQWCDQLESITAGAILGFSGIMLAADLVLLSAENKSCIAIDGWLALLAFIAIIPLTAAAILALTAFVTLRYTGNKSSRPVNSLGALCLHIRHRTDLNRWSTVSAIVGVALVLSALAIRSYGFLAANMTCG